MRHGGALSPDTGIVDSHTLMASPWPMRRRTARRRRGVARGVRRGAGRGGHRVTARDESGETAAIEALWVVNAAGLDADTVAGLAGFDLDACGYRQRYARGRYFRVAALAKSHLARHLIYPAPPQESLGIHVTLDLAGACGSGRPRVPERPAAGLPWRTARASLHAAVSRYLEGLAPEDLAPDLAGIRPRLQGPGEPVPRLRDPRGVGARDGPAG